MAEPKKPQKKTYDVTSAFIWDKQIKKPGTTVDLTDAEAQGLKARGKIEDQTPKKAKPEAKTEAKKDDGIAPAAPAA